MCFLERRFNSESNQINLLIEFLLFTALIYLKKIWLMFWKTETSKLIINTGVQGNQSGAKHTSQTHRLNIK